MDGWTEYGELVCVGGHRGPWGLFLNAHLQICLFIGKGLFTYIVIGQPFAFMTPYFVDRNEAGGLIKRAQVAVLEAADVMNNYAADWLESIGTRESEYQGFALPPPNSLPPLPPACHSPPPLPQMASIRPPPIHTTRRVTSLSVDVSTLNHLDSPQYTTASPLCTSRTPPGFRTEPLSPTLSRTTSHGDVVPPCLPLASPLSESDLPPLLE